MRISILTTSTTLHRMGGTEVHAETLAKAAASEGHEVTIITTSHPRGELTEKKSGYTVIYLPGTSFEMSRRHLRAWWEQSAAKLTELHKAGAVDVVWAENLIAQDYVSRVPASLRPPVIAIINGPGLRGDILSRWAQVNSVPTLIYFFTRSLPQVLFYLLPWYRRVSRRSEYIVAVSGYCEAEILKEFPACRGRIKTILNPVDTGGIFQPSAARRGAARERYGLGADAPVIAMSGVLHSQKGMHKGIEAFRLIKNFRPEAKLIIAGDGPEMGSLNQLAAGLGLEDSVVFCGGVANEQMGFFYNAADIYLNPTLRQEGLPITILEAMACGLPCVISLAGGTADTIEDGISGFFVKAGSTAELAKKTLLLLRDPGLSRAMGERARQRAVEVFSVKGAVNEYLDLSRTLIAGRG